MKYINEMIYISPVQLTENVFKKYEKLEKNNEYIYFE